jgi:hypothetical protein
MDFIEDSILIFTVHDIQQKVGSPQNTQNSLAQKVCEKDPWADPTPFLEEL